MKSAALKAALRAVRWVAELVASLVDWTVESKVVLTAKMVELLVYLSADMLVELTDKALV